MKIEVSGGYKLEVLTAIFRERLHPLSMYVNITSDLESNPMQSPMEVGFWIWDFQVFKTKVQTIMDLMGRKVKI